MSLIQIRRMAASTSRFALFNVGFRPFFLAASLFASISITGWMLVYFSYFPVPPGNVNAIQWHSHEMIYGYGLSVIAGFLLTAIENWTGIQSVHGKSLVAFFTLWLIPRVLLLFGTTFLEVAVAADLLFVLFLLFLVLSPIVKSRQWRQLGIAAKILLLAIGNLCFYLGALGILESGIRLGIYGGLYTVIGLILTIATRVYPIFIRNGVNYHVILKNPKWLAVVNLVAFLAFFLNELFVQNQEVRGCTAIALFAINLARLFHWHTYGIWTRPLLWSIYLSLVFIDVGFLLFALAAFGGLSPYLAVHALAVGGIGLSTMGMMSRVSLGHTGRSVLAPSPTTTLSLSLLTIGAVMRFGILSIDQAHYSFWIFFSQLLWIVAFFIFFMSHLEILLRPRFDGEAG